MMETNIDDSAENATSGLVTTSHRKRLKSRRKILRCTLIVMGVSVVTAVLVLIVIYASKTKVSARFPTLEWVDVEVPTELHSTQPFTVGRNLLVPQGYGVRVYGRVPSARFLLVLPNGDVLVSQPNLKTISLLRPPISSKKPAERLTFATGLDKPHDMVFYKDKEGGKYIYVAEATRVTRHRYKDGEQTIGLAEVIVDNLPYFTGYRHPLKNIAIGNNTLYVSIGSETNADPHDLEQDPKRGAIYGHSLTRGGEKRLICEGVRNAEGLAFAPGTNDLWVVVNQRDEIKYPYKDKTGNYGKVLPDYVDNNPPEELSKIIEGVNYGWPYCNPVGSESMNDLEYVPDVDANPNESVVKCSTFRKVDKGLEPHSAPLGFSFWEGENVPSEFKNSGLVGLHGSWNRQSYSGHKVMLYPWVNGRPGNPYELMSGWIMDPVKKIRWGRPVDVAVLKDGSLLVSDDSTGAIYQLYKKS